jgi:archaemetzincin
MKKILVLLLLVLITNNQQFPYNKVKFIEKENLIINITTMGEVDNYTVELVKSEAEKFYNAKIIILPRTKLLTECKIKNTEKYSGGLLLDSVNQIYNKEKHKVLLLTNYDICVDRNLNGKIHKNWSVLGLAYLNKKPAIVSTYRIKNKDRLIKVSIHEIGHTLGITHCDNTECVMVDAKGKAINIDKAKLWMCDKCKSKIKT